MDTGMTATLTQSQEIFRDTLKDIKTIIKRDGSVQEFDLAKIVKAIQAAAKSSVSEELDGRTISAILRRFTELVQQHEGNLDVESIQDYVEMSLMASKQYLVAKNYMLYRSKRADLRKGRAKPSMESIRDYVLMSKYAKYIPELNRRELFNETVDRREAMELRKFPSLAEDIKWAFGFTREFKVFPSMRSMQFGGIAVEKQNARNYNCSFTHIDRTEVFKQIFHLLLCGCGVGYSVQQQHVDKLPNVGFVGQEVEYFDIPDSIEGWADAVGVLVDSYMDPASQFYGKYVEFGYSKIRKKGALLKTSGGRAPGHMPLKLALEHVRRILTAASGRSLRPIEAHDLICFMADAVLSGGIRRSALICLFSLNDSEMMYAKTGNWWVTNPQRARANNSVALLRDRVSKKHYDRIFKAAKEFGEPGVYFLDDLDYGCNPCVVGETWIDILDEKTGTCTQEQVRRLEGKQFKAVIHAATASSKVKSYSSCPKGFYQTGMQPTYVVKTDAGTVRTTGNHLFMAVTGAIDNATSLAITWVKAADLQPGMTVVTSQLSGRVANEYDDSFVANREKHVLTAAVLEIKYDSKLVPVYDCSIPEINMFSANGHIVHNCSEILLNPILTITPAIRKMINDKFAALQLPPPKVKLGERYSGFSFCNLCEINVANVSSKEDFFERCRAASIMGTLQASYTSFPYLGWVSEIIAEREALLGISMTGIMANPNIALNPEVLQEGADIVVSTNIEYAAKIGIRPSARSTTVKPAGTSTLAFGISESGITPAHATRYFRRIRANELEPVFKYFQSINPHMCERVANSDTDWYILFPIEVLPGTVVKDEMNGVKLLECVKLVQKHWVEAGVLNTEFTHKGRHSVSNTITVMPNDWDAVRDYIWDNRDTLNGVSTLPHDGDKKYVGAPFESVLTEADEAKWNYLIDNYKPVDYSKLIEAEDNTAFSLESACAGGACQLR